MEKMDLRKQVAQLTEQKRISEQERIRQQAANQLMQEEYKQDTLRFSSRTSFFKILPWKPVPVSGRISQTSRISVYSADKPDIRLDARYRHRSPVYTYLKKNGKSAATETFKKMSGFLQSDVNKVFYALITSQLVLT